MQDVKFLRIYLSQKYETKKNEVSNMMIIDKTMIIPPDTGDKKSFIEDAFETDNIVEKSPNGIADNHPEWMVSEEIGQKSLDLYLKRMVKNLEAYLQ